MDGTGAFYVSVKTYGGRLTAISGNTFEDFYAKLVAAVGSLAADEYLSQLAVDIVDNPKRPDPNVTPSGSGGTYPRSQSQPRSADGPPPGQDIPRCQHGDMVRKTGTSAKGAWGAYFCPDPVKANRCDPVWDKKG